MQSMFARAPAGAILLTLGGCLAGGPAHRAPPAALPGTEACIFTVNLFDWRVLDDSSLIVYAPGQRQPYLLRLFTPVLDLPFQETLGFEGVEHNGRLCKGDFVIVRGTIPSRTMIDAVRLITPAQAKELVQASAHPAAAGGTHHD